MNARKKYLDKLTAPITQGKDGRWFTRVPDPSKGDHGRRMIRGNSEEEVENKVIMFFMEQEAGCRKESCTVADCWQRWYDFRREHNKRLAPSSFQIYRQCWKRYFEGTEFASRKVADVTDLDIEKFMIETIEKRGMNRKCAQELAYHLRNIFKKAFKDRIIASNPWNYVDLQDTVYPACSEPEVKHDKEMVLSPEQAELLSRTVEEHLEQKPDYIPDYAILVCKYTGMRPGEVAALMWDDITDDYIILKHSEHRWSDENGGKQIFKVSDPKCHKDRLVPVCAELKEVFDRIREVQERNGWEDEYVFFWENEKGVLGRMTANTLQKAMLQRGKHAGLDGTATAYRFRRTVESGLRAQGKSGEAVGHMLGHSSNVGARHYAYDMEMVPAMQQAVSRIYTLSGMKDQHNASMGNNLSPRVTKVKEKEKAPER